MSTERRTRIGSSLVSVVLLSVAVILGANDPLRPSACPELPTPARKPAANQTELFFPVVRRGSWEVVPSGSGTQLMWQPQDPSWPDKALLAVDQAGQAGASWIRIPITWEWHQPQPGVLYWPPEYDAMLAHAASRRIQVILTLEGNPQWACQPPSCPYPWFPGGPVEDVDALVEFVQAAVQYYGAGPFNVKHWEFYNEADNRSYSLCVNRGFGCFGDYPEEYASELATFYTAVKTADPQAQVLFSGLAYDRWTSEHPDNPFVEEFLDEVLEWFQVHNEGVFAFDMMNFHYYPLFRSKWDAFGLGPDIIGKAAYIRNKLASYGADKPVVCTETGMWSSSDSPPPWTGSPELQSRYVPQVFVRSQAADIAPTIWFWLLDQEWEHTKYGLLDSDWNPKPAFLSFQTLSRQLSRAGFVRAWGPSDTGSEDIEAYEFLAPDGQTQIVVAWTDDDAMHSLSLAGTAVTVVDKEGAEAVVRDGGASDCDGMADGQVCITIGPSPVYLRTEE